VAYFTRMSTLVGGPFVHMSGITDMEIARVNGQMRLFSASFADGGLQSFAISGGASASFVDAMGAGPSRGTYGVSDILLLDVGGQDILLPSGRYDDMATVIGLDANGGFGAITPVSSPTPQDIAAFSETAAITVASGTYVYAAQAGRSGLQKMSLASSLDLTYDSHLSDAPGVHLGDVSALETMQIRSRSFLFVASAFDAGITSYQITSKGHEFLRDTVNPQDASGFSTPTVLDTVTSGGKDFLLMGAAGTDSLSVYHVSHKGHLRETDFRLDTIDTRFKDIAAIDHFAYKGHSFVLAGGSDDGVTLFELNPDGTLFTLDSVADQADTTLQNVQSITSYVFNNQVQVFVAGGSEAGITQFSLDLGALGDVIQGSKKSETLVGGAGDDLILGGRGRDNINGGAGNDRLMDGKGKDIMTGGPGADVFVFHQDGQTDTVTDFVLGQDRIDLSDFDMLYHYSALTIIDKAWGYLIYANGEALRLYTPAAQHGIAPEFSQHDFIF